TARVRVVDNGPTNAVGSSNTFSIRTPAVTVTAPAAGATVDAAALSVTWTQNVLAATSVRVELSRDGGATFQTLAAAAPTGQTGGSYSGAAPGADSSNAVVRVTTNGAIVTSGSSAAFTL